MSIELRLPSTELRVPRGQSDSQIMKMAFLVFFLLVVVQLGFAEGTRLWQQSKLEEFSKGTAHGVAIGSDGSLTPAPAFVALATTPSSYLWDLAVDAQGNVFAAAGSPARVYRIAADGKVTVVFRPQELQVQALAVDAKGAVFAATSPDGKVYKIERVTAGASAPPAEKKAAPPESAAEKRAPDAKAPAAEVQLEAPVDLDYSSSLFFDPKTKYIWDLLPDGPGRLYVATGDRGEIFRVDAGGKGTVFFKSDEGHIRSLALDAGGNLIAGSDGSGLIYRISPAGEAFVVYSAAKREITALAVDAKGNLYAAGLGEKRTGATPSTPQIPAVAGSAMATTVAGSGAVTVSVPISPPPPPPVSSGPSPVPGGSEVYRIAADGSPRTLWSSREHLVYALALGADGRLLAGTGNQGRIFALEADGDYADLLMASANQVTALAPVPDGGLFAATGNLGKVFRMGAGTKPAEARFESDVFDARIFSRWGRLETRGSGDFELFARSGNVDNPDRNWSPWKKVDAAKGSAIEAPPARFLQWKTVLSSGPRPGRVESVVVSYRPKNVAPQVSEVAVQVGARFPQAPRPQQESVNISVGQSTPNPPAPRVEPTPSAVRDRGWIGARWAVRDENDDDLLYSIYYRGDGEKSWKLLKEKIEEKFHSWEAGLLPDGGYTVKVVASDARSNPAEEALSDEKESAHFEVDATPPRVEGLSAAAQSANARVIFRASDSYSPIQRAEYSLDAGEWRRVEPAGKIADSTSESYDFTVPLPPGGGEHVVVVRVYDRFENMGAAKALIK